MKCKWNICEKKGEAKHPFSIYCIGYFHKTIIPVLRKEVLSDLKDKLKISKGKKLLKLLLALFLKFKISRNISAK